MKFVLYLCLLFISALMDVESKQMPADNVPQIKYDVFVNFRGEDIRRGFLGYLTEAFRQKQIHAFVDDKLEKGDEIWPSLVGAIQGSMISLTIFSENYASSRWCLEELVTILECREKYNQTVIPVFYHVYPTDVRHQSGTYENALDELGKKYNLTTVQNWRDALKKAANLSGLKSFDYKTEVELLGEIINIVNLVLTRLGKHPPQLKSLVGIGKPIQCLESLLYQESKNVRVIGIWGMGGVGKTTIAEEIYNKLYFQYDGYCFLENVMEESRRHGIISLKEKLFSTLLVEVKMNTANGLSNYIKRKIGRMKVLIVLDDVNDSVVLEKLFGNRDWFGPGSRIIITTRDKQVLIANKVDDIYQVGVLNCSEALELFSLYAFNQNQNHFDVEYYKLSKRVVNYAKGIPLVLKVLGHLLCGKNKEVWKSQLDKLKKVPNTDVYNTMRLSYDDLDRNEKKIFLDLGCFFKGLNLKVDRLKFLLKDDEGDNSVVVGLESLKDKALITISDDNVVYMHDIIQEMAREIVRHESIKDPRSHSRLRDSNDIYEVLRNNKGTEAIRSLRADLSKIGKLKLSPDIFTKMSKLQFLYFVGKYNRCGFDLLPHGLQSFPVEVRYLVWKHYPLKSLPKNFSPENLVILDLSCSQVEKLWAGVQNLVNLKEVLVSGSKNLKELPDFSKATNLEVLDIRACPQLTSVSPSIFSLNKLKTLALGNCSLTKFISDNHLCSLSCLSLRMCDKLREFSVTSENMIQLDLSYTNVNALPSSFGRQIKLESLWLMGSVLKNLPSSLRNLTRLRLLSVYNSKKLCTLTELPPALEILDASYCTSLKTVLFPSIAEQFKENRRYFVFWNCLKLDNHSLKAIGLNAHINVVRMTYQHLSAPVKNYHDYNSRSGIYDQAMYVYPGSRVPEWLEYQTTKDYIIIDLPSTPHSSQLGFIFGFVISNPNPKTIGHEFSVYITISVDEDESKKDSFDIYLNGAHIWFASDHVCVVYDQPCSHFLNSKAKNLTRLKIKVKAMATGVAHGLNLRGFGVRLVNPSAFHNLMEYINATMYLNFTQQISSTEDHSFIQDMEMFNTMYFIHMFVIILCIVFVVNIDCHDWHHDRMVKNVRKLKR